MTNDLNDRLRAIEEREALLAEAEQIARMGTWTWHVADDSVYWSDELYRILGYDKAVDLPSVEGFFGAIHPEDLPALQAESAKMAQTGKSVARVVRIVRPSGEIRVIRLTSASVQGADGAPVRMVGSILDLTDTLAQQQELAKSHERLNEAQRLANVGSWVWHVRTGKIRWSDQMFRICGRDPHTYTPTVDAFINLLHSEDKARVTDAIQSSLSDSFAEIECTIVLDNGAERSIHITSKLVKSDDSGPLVLHGTMHDITDRKELEGQLRQSQKIEALGMLAGGIAHDLNNYLQIIQGNLAVLDLCLSCVQPQVARAREDITASLELCSSLTKGLVAYSRQQELAPELVDLHTIVTSSLHLVAKLLGAHIETKFDLAAAHSHVLVDRNQLQQVIVNLAINARDAMDGSGQLSVSTGNLGGRDNGYVELRVTDTGQGMSQHVAGRAFDPFFTTKPVGHGTGLGLSTVYGIVERSGGSITVESTLDVGSTFIIQLPLQQPPQPETVQEPIIEAAPALAFGKKILIAEDERMVRRMAKILLQRAGFSVVEAADGREALDIVLGPGGDAIGLVLSDVTMPNLDGPTLAVELARQGRSLPFVLMTGYTNQAHLISDVTSVRAVLQKPFSNDQLVGCIRQVISELPVT
ncbi:MAG: PAS domain-containing protein [Myxococcales bacterium]|nr:PAS domain-containing protein [Myxococcales bacterium]